MIKDYYEKTEFIKWPLNLGLYHHNNLVDYLVNFKNEKLYFIFIYLFFNQTEMLFIARQK
jgi:hypothetical protein